MSTVAYVLAFTSIHVFFVVDVYVHLHIHPPYALITYDNILVLKLFYLILFIFLSIRLQFCPC